MFHTWVGENRIKNISMNDIYYHLQRYLSLMLFYPSFFFIFLQDELQTLEIFWKTNQFLRTKFCHFKSEVENIANRLFFTKYFNFLKISENSKFAYFRKLSQYIQNIIRKYCEQAFFPKYFNFFKISENSKFAKF